MWKKENRTKRVEWGEEVVRLNEMIEVDKKRIINIKL
jgi:hypothetical protein